MIYFAMDKLLAFVAMQFCFLQLSTLEESRMYLKYVKEITNSFVNEMESEYGFHCIGGGGSMPKDVEKIQVIFITHQKSTIKDAREIEIKAITKLLDKINAHEKIRPFLREFPFGPSRVGVSISFQDKEDHYYLENSVAYVFLAKSKIFYCSAEKIKEMVPGGCDCSDPDNIIDFPPVEEEVEKLVDLFEEPYEEALKIISTNELNLKSIPLNK